MINNLLESVLKETMGLNISSIGQRTLKNAVARRMRAVSIDTSYSYLNLIKSSNQEMNELINEVAVNETWFFRDKAPFSALSQYAREWQQKGCGSTLKVLSIPCATGEEPYSIAIALYEAGLDQKLFSIDAIDISTRSLKIAQKGIYRQRSFRSNNRALQQLYFNKKKNGYTIDEKIKRTVKFYKGNLIKTSFPLSFARFNIIFCRNLLIYMDASFHEQIRNTLYQLLQDDGILFIGHSEPGLFADSQFVLSKYSTRSFSYLKRSFPKDAAQKESNKTIITPPIQLKLPSVNAQEEPELSNSPEKDYSRAKKLAEQGEFERAVKLCENYINQNGPSADSFFLLAIIFDGQADLKNAVKMLKKALYLNSEFLNALNFLASIYKRIGDNSNYEATVRRCQRVKKRLACHQAVEGEND